MSHRYHSYQEWVGWGELHRWHWQKLFTSCSAPNKWSLSTTKSHLHLHFHSAQGWAARSSRYNNFYHSFYSLELTHTHVPRRPSSFCDFWKSILPVLPHHLILLYYLCHEFSSIPVVLHIVAFLKRQPFPMITTMMKVKIITIILVLLMIYVKNYQ